ncbi:MAG: hypothetical protein U0324_35030 [Polyangiales bacterium]
MPESEPREVFLEVDASPSTPAPAAPSASGAPWLEPASAPDDGLAEGPAGGQRRKVRAADRTAPLSDQVSVAVVAALVTDRPLMAALWPDVAPAELLRTPPPDAALRARCDFARRAIDAVARRDAAARAQAEVAQRALQSRLDALGPEDGRAEAALAELRRAQVAALEEALRVLAGAPRPLTPAELERLVEAAESRGLDADTARGVARERGYALPAPGQGSWSPLHALPGAPSTMDDAAVALLRHPAQGYEAVRSGTVLAWLRANAASPEVVSRSRDARQVADRGDAESLALHSQAWALGLRVLVVGATWLRSPGEIAAAVRRGSVVLDDLSRAAREGTLGAWLRAQGWAPAAGAADLVARGEATGMKRLAWSLGEPLVVGDAAVGDPDSLARAVLSRPELREPLASLHASGDLLAWLESLPPVLRDEQWADRLRRARADARRTNDQLPVWRGLYQHARTTTLTVADGAGNAVVLTSPAPLRVTAQVADVWDSLKRALRTGELLAWLDVVAPGVELPALPRPPRDEDRELNALLWALDHRGLVLEWGPADLGVTSPEDLVRAYERSWQQLEAQTARGYVLDWLERFHGGANVLPSAPGAAAVALRDAVAWLRGEAGRLPAGHLALKLALLCGMRHLPLDPTAPGDRATFRGYTHVTGATGGSRRRWEPLRDQAASGSAVLWVALSNVTDAVTARGLFHNAFLAPAQARAADHADEVIGMLARSFGDPVPSPALAVDLPDTTARHVPAAGAPPAARGSWLTALVVLASLAGVGFGAWSWWAARVTADPPEPAAAVGTEVWVQIKVRMDADRTRLGRPWDPDDSPPDLRGTVRPRGESVHIGPCEGTRHCEGTIDAARLVPGVPFRVAVDEMDWALPDRVGGAWFIWRGGREETLHTRLGGVEVTVTVKRLAFQPPAPPVATTEPAPEPPAARVDAGTARVDAGAGRRPRMRRDAGATKGATGAF